MNIIETRAVLNIVKTDGKCVPEAKREDLELCVCAVQKYFKNGIFSKSVLF